MVQRLNWSMGGEELRFSSIGLDLFSILHTGSVFFKDGISQYGEGLMLPCIVTRCWIFPAREEIKFPLILAKIDSVKILIQGLDWSKGLKG